MVAPTSEHLSDWLAWLETLHPKAMDLGLARIQQVAERLQLLTFTMPVITVGGTNGKGSCVAFLQHIYTQAGYKVGAYTSPHLLTYNERIQINGQPVSDTNIVATFQAIEAARGDITLTFFEYGTLAALWIFQRANLDVVILEVGLGGRLDAVNIVDADLAIVASIDLDHTEWLGNTREAIAIEKAGIFRANTPVVCGDFNPPASLLHCAKQLNAPLYCQANDFVFTAHAQEWDWACPSLSQTLVHLPFPLLALQNAATALMAVQLLQAKIPVNIDAIKKGIAQANVPGRFQQIHTEPNIWVDVAHNPAAANLLLTRLQQLPEPGNIYAVFSALNDKDIDNIVLPFKTLIKQWFVGPLPTNRSHTIEDLQFIMQHKHGLNVTVYNDILSAYQQAYKQARPNDTIIVFGSFYTVAEVLANHQV